MQYSAVPCSTVLYCKVQFKYSTVQLKYSAVTSAVHKSPKLDIGMYIYTHIATHAHT